MFTQSNNHPVEYVTASGVLGFDGKGWLWEKPLIAAGLMKPELFTNVLRTLTLEPRPYPISNLSWERPWTWLPWSSRSCVQFLPNGGVVNKVGLWNPGIKAWCEKIAPTIDFKKWEKGGRLVGSIYGTKEELEIMAEALNAYDLVALEVNVSCPNTGHRDMAEQIIESAVAVDTVSHHPIWLKLSSDQMTSFYDIAEGVCGHVEAFSLNSVPYKLIFPDGTSPVEKLGKPGSGAGGVSGKPAQKENWRAIEILVRYGHGIPVIGSSVMEYGDLAKVRALGAKAVSFGAIHCRTPWKPTQIAKHDRKQTVLRDSYPM